MERWKDGRDGRMNDFSVSPIRFDRDDVSDLIHTENKESINDLVRFIKTRIEWHSCPTRKIYGGHQMVIRELEIILDHYYESHPDPSREDK